MIVFFEYFGIETSIMTESVVGDGGRGPGGGGHR